VIDSLFPVFTITLVVYIFLALIQGDLNYIKPILFDNTSNVIRAVAPSYKAFVGYGAIAYILCYTKPLKGTYKWFAFGMAIPVIFTTAAGLAVLLNFGPEEVVTIVYPFLTLSKSIEFPTTLIERLESFSVIIWIPAVVSTVIMYTYVSIRNFTVLLNISPKQKKYIVYAHIPVMTFIALIYRNSLEVIRYFHLVDTLAAILGLGMVPVFTLIAFIKRRRKME
jgi:spore germination protein